MSKISRRDQSIGRKEKVNQHHPLRSPQASEEGKNGGGMPFSTERRIPTACRNRNMANMFIFDKISRRDQSIGRKEKVNVQCIMMSLGMITVLPGMIIKSKMMLIHRKNELNPPLPPFKKGGELGDRRINMNVQCKMYNVQCKMKIK